MSQSSFSGLVRNGEEREKSVNTYTVQPLAFVYSYNRCPLQRRREFREFRSERWSVYAPAVYIYIHKHGSYSIRAADYAASLFSISLILDAGRAPRDTQAAYF